MNAMPQTLSNTLAVASDLIKTCRKAAPLNNKIDLLKKEMRDIGPGDYRVPGEGLVTVKKPSVSAPKGTELQLNLEAFEALPDSEKAYLISTGIVKMVTVYSRASASSVTVQPS